MTKHLLYNITALIILCMSCRKSDNPNLPDGLTSAPIPQLSKDSSGDLNISSGDITGFKGKVIIDQYYKSDHSYASMEAVVIKNGDRSNVKVLQAGITTLPATVGFDAKQLSDLFGEAVVPGDSYDIGADAILQNGQRIKAFESDGNPNFDPNIAALPGIGAGTINYAVFCPYDAEQYQGDFIIVEDDWQDYAPGDVIPLTKIDDTHFSFEYNCLDPQPIVITVDPATNTTSVSKQYFGNYGEGTGMFFAESVAGSPNNYVIPCNGTVSVVLHITSDVLGDFGNSRLVMQKQ